MEAAPLWKNSLHPCFFSVFKSISRVLSLQYTILFKSQKVVHQVSSTMHDLNVSTQDVSRKQQQRQQKRVGSLGPK